MSWRTSVYFRVLRPSVGHGELSRPVEEGHGPSVLDELRPYAELFHRLGVSCRLRDPERVGKSRQAGFQPETGEVEPERYGQQEVSTPALSYGVKEHRKPLRKRLFQVFSAVHEIEAGLEDELRF